MYARFLRVLSLGLICTVLNKFHYVDCIFQCNITPTKHPTSMAVVLNCTFNERSVDAAMWTRDGQPVDDKEILVDSGETKKWSAVILSNSTHVQDVGKLTCTGKSNQKNFSCSVHPSKPMLEAIKPVIIAIDGGTPEVGECKARGWPVPRVTWWRKGTNLRNYDYLSSYILTRYAENWLSMKITTIEGYHHGTHTCRADNLFGTAVENVIVMVKRQDMIKYDYREELPSVAIEGKNTTIECICFNPLCKEQNATTYWKYHGSNVNTTRKIRVSKEVLSNDVKIVITILNVSRTDQGDYYCGINTTEGFDEKRRTLYILTKDNAPQISASANVVSTNPSSHAWLKCKTTYPGILTEPDTFWVFNSSRIPQESQHYHIKRYGPNPGPNSTKFILFELRISNVSAKDVGWYTCGVDFKLDVIKANVFLRFEEEENEDVEHQNTDTESKDNRLIAISSITAGGIIMGFVAAFVAYRLCRNKRDSVDKFFDTPSVNDRHFKYDVFVTFSSQDLNWVTKELLPLLEKHKLNYCIHDRDFEIGKPVVDNMADSVYTSRKVLAVMSRNYMSSKFCRGELEMALYRSTEMGDSSVIVMRIDNIDRSKLPKALRNRTFLDHHDLTERKTWEERLIKHLKPPPDKSAEKKSSEKIYSLLKDAEV